MQQAVITRWEDLNGCKVLGGCKTCNLGSLGMLVWVVVLDWMRVWDYVFFFLVSWDIVSLLFCCFSFLLFSSEMGKSMFCTTFLSRNTHVLDFNFNIVYHGLIRAALSLALNIMSFQLTLAAWKDPLTPGKSETYIYIVLTLFLFVNDYHCFWC